MEGVREVLSEGVVLVGATEVETLISFLEMTSSSLLRTLFFLLFDVVELSFFKLQSEKLIQRLCPLLSSPHCVLC